MIAASKFNLFIENSHENLMLSAFSQQEAESFYTRGFSFAARVAKC